MRSVSPVIRSRPLPIRNHCRYSVKSISGGEGSFGGHDALQPQFDRLARQLSIQSKEDWYKITTTLLRRLGAASLLKGHKGSLALALTAAYPDHHWQFWKLAKEPQRYWKEPQHAREFLEWAAAEMKMQRLEDWYHVNFDRLKSICQGLGIFSKKRENNSLYQVLSAAFPEHDWQWWKFDRAPPIAASSRELHVKFFSSFAKEMQLEDVTSPHALGEAALSQWHRITLSDISNRGGTPILKKHRWSVALTLMTLFPNQKWLPWKFDRVPPGWWENTSNHLSFFIWLSQELNIPLPNTDGTSTDALPAAPDAWYSLDRATVRSLGGATMLARFYNDSLPLALTSVFNKWKWTLWKFPQIPKAALEAQKNRSHSTITLRDWLEHFAAPLLHVDPTDLSAWYRVSEQQLRETGTRAWLAHFDCGSSLPAALQIAYPNHSWRANLFNTGVTKKASQRLLKALLQKIFPNEELKEEVAVAAPIKGNFFFDIVIPSLRLAFEYQGVHHYSDVTETGQSQRKDSIDQMKLAACHREGLSLISIPYAVKLTEKAIRTFIARDRPELIRGDDAPLHKR
eukprot:TRINITY_DN11454_c0_g1_i1.p1 TRINITY_DN11454_c0_g1~~TRINITY_DN11454_c0_g1_i1.p1  ORF type:complete len:569 (+),score=79.95 TRINITY_DN11454_c0_g1_i1:76-1782(+)